MHATHTITFTWVQTNAHDVKTRATVVIDYASTTTLPSIHHHTLSLSAFCTGLVVFELHFKLASYNSDLNVWHVQLFFVVFLEAAVLMAEFVEKLRNMRFCSRMLANIRSDTVMSIKTWTVASIVIFYIHLALWTRLIEMTNQYNTHRHFIWVTGRAIKAGEFERIWLVCYCVALDSDH